MTWDVKVMQPADGSSLHVAPIIGCNCLWCAVARQAIIELNVAMSQPIFGKIMPLEDDE